MSTPIDRRVITGVGLVAIVAGLLVVIQLPAANQYHEATLSAAGVGVFPVLYGTKTLAEVHAKADRVDILPALKGEAFSSHFRK